MKRGLNREVAAVLPWLGAAFLWFGVIAPLRADQENRLLEQGRVRRDRVKADRSAREVLSLLTRVGRALGAACRASADPAALRQRTVAATSGLSLSPFTLSVTGGPDAGAVIEAEGSRDAVEELLRRLGDPARGGFLRSTTIREKGARWSVSSTTGVLESFPGGIVPPRPSCSDLSDPGPTEAAPEPTRVRPRHGPTQLLAPSGQPPDPVSVAPSPEPTPAPPFTLVAFLMSERRSRVSVRVGDQVRIVAVGDQVDGWRCVSIDRDEGAVFTSPSAGRLVLKAGQ